MDGLLQPMGNSRRDRGVQGVVPEELFDAAKLAGGGLLGLLVPEGVLLLLVQGSEFALLLHSTTSSCLLEKDGEGLAGAMELAAHRIGGLVGKGADLFIAQLLVGDQQEEQPVFRGEAVQGCLDALAQLLGLEDPQRRIGLGGMCRSCQACWRLRQ
jgi:hypothetical protein